MQISATEVQCNHQPLQPSNSPNKSSPTPVLSVVSCAFTRDECTHFDAPELLPIVAVITRNRSQITICKPADGGFVGRVFAGDRRGCVMQ
jgi:hypothetical protein